MLTRRKLVISAVAGLAVGEGLVGTARADQSGYEETYQGRVIRLTGPPGAPMAAAVTIDGRPLSLMKVGDDAYLSPLCHYEVVASPLVAARRAVEELHGAELLTAAAGEAR